jgi:hypothetical protein
MLVAVLGLGSAFVSGCPDVESGRSASEQWITARPCAQAHPPVLESCVAAKGSGYGVDVIEKQRALIREANWMCGATLFLSHNISVPRVQ